MPSVPRGLISVASGGWQLMRRNSRRSYDIELDLCVRLTGTGGHALTSTVHKAPRDVTEVKNVIHLQNLLSRYLWSNRINTWVEEHENQEVADGWPQAWERLWEENEGGGDEEGDGEEGSWSGGNEPEEDDTSMGSNSVDSSSDVSE
eukprot:SAG11_NODE_917_length_6553_cov_24.570654_4_plen_147_part_00